MEAVVTKPPSMMYKNVYEKLITGILFCENLCLPVVDVHDDVGTGSANKTSCTCTSQRHTSSTVAQTCNYKKMEIFPVSLHNTVIDQKHRQGEWSTALQYSQISCLCT